MAHGPALASPPARTSTAAAFALFAILAGSAALGPATALAQGDVSSDGYVVSAPSAVVYSEPSSTSRPAGRLARGRPVRSTGERRDGFIALSTRSGQKIWIRESDVRAVAAAPANLEDDVERPPLQPVQAGGVRGEPRPRSVRSSGLMLPPRATFDLGVAGGSFVARGRNYSYTEVNLGLNLYFYDWLDWRNAVFGRFISDSDSVYGLDSSLRGILSLGDSSLGLTAFAGPGWRFPSNEGGIPFAEAGVVFRLPGVALGGGARSFLRSWVNSGQENETQYFIILSGGGSL